MCRKIISVILVLMLCATLVFSVSAEEVNQIIMATVGENEQMIRQHVLFDDADLLTANQEEALAEDLRDVSTTYLVQLCVATIPSLEGTDIDDYIEEVYDGMGLGYGDGNDGVLLIVCMDPREFRILSNGTAADAITMGAIDSITDAITPQLKDGDYAGAFKTYGQECGYYLQRQLEGESPTPFKAGKSLIIALVIGLLVGLIVASVLKGQLKSVRSQNQANVYVKDGSMNLTQAQDFFLYRNVTKTAKPQSNSSGSGSSRNVGGGSF